MEKISRLPASLRFTEFMDSILIVCVACLLSMLYQGADKGSIRVFLIFVPYLLLLGVYGYGINSFADSKQDKIVGKIHFFTNLAKTKSIWVLAFLALAFLSVSIAFFDLRVVLYSVFLVFLATAYSLKPLRFKERGIMGVFASALTHGVLPFLVFAYSINLSWIIGTYFFIFMALTEFIGDLIHHISDFDNDEVTRTKTWIKEIGIEKSRKILKAMLIVLFFYPFVSFLFLKWEYGAIFAIVNFILAAHIYLEDLVGSF